MHIGYAVSACNDEQVRTYTSNQNGHLETVEMENGNKKWKLNIVVK